jgi:diguanylate cyclase (GGDEF)-like protein/PAS domain S-box-containing protein
VLNLQDDRFTALATRAPVGIYEVEPDGTFIWGNDRFFELVGVDGGSFDSRIWSKSIHPDDYTVLVEAWRVALADGREFELEYRLLQPDGETVWVVSRSRTIRDADGAITSCIGSLTEITSRKQAEQELALSAEVMRDMAEGVCVVRASDATIVFVNPTFEQMMGYEPGELCGQPLLVLQPRVTSADDRALQRSVFDRLASDGRVSYDSPSGRKDGSTIWCRTTVSTFDHPEHGTVWVAVQRDVTEERAVNEALRAADERFRRAFEDSASGMALIEGRGEEIGRFREVNRALVQMSGYSPEELLEMSYWDLVHPDEVETMRRGVAELVVGRAITFQAELRMVGAGEIQHWIAFNVSLLRDADGEPLSAVVQAQDVTERKRFETELQYLADHDSLTGLYNRRRFAAELERELAAAERYTTGGALLILDLDSFKVVNDSRGHGAGDELLIAVARAIQGRLRTTDVVGRLGGDEFGIVLPHADREKSLATAESLRSVVAAAVDARAGANAVTTSVGVAQFGNGGTARGVDRLVSDADAAMYSAKQAGRDRVHIFTEGETRAALRIV